MFSESRKAQHNSFAHHRANLLFSRPVAEVRGATLWAAIVHESTQPGATQHPGRTGTLSLRPAAVAAAIPAAYTGLSA
jgi:hypothetical protein